MNKQRRIVATIEARMTSRRLPGKVLMEAAGKPMLEHMVERLRRVPSLGDIVIATTSNATDDHIEELALRLGIGCFRGSENDVLARVLGAARAYDIDVIVQTTGDCPLIDPELVEICVKGYEGADVDYVSNVLERTYPIGMDTQVFATEILADVSSRTDHPDDREHVSLYIYRHPEIYSLLNMPGPEELTRPELALTLDTAEDYELIRTIFERLCPKDPAFGLADILRLLDMDRSLMGINEYVRQKHA